MDSGKNIIGLIVFVAIQLTSPRTAAMLLSGPEIIAFTVSPTNADVLSIKVEDQAHLTLNFTAISTNTGQTFNRSISPFSAQPINTNVSIARRRYLLADGFLLRSDDAGLTWTNTTAVRFLRKQTDAAMEQEIAEYNKTYGKRLPERSAWWTPIFATFAIIYLIVVFASRRKAQDWISSLQSAMQSAAILLVVWIMLTATSSQFRFLSYAQWPARFYNTSEEFNPSFKTGVIMNVAARPLPLLAYLALISLILPGSLDGFIFRKSDPKPSKLRSCIPLIAVSFVIGVHFYFAFIGYFAE